MMLPSRQYVKRIFFILIAILIGTLSYGQTCECAKDSMLRDIISCDTIKFDNKSILYWSFDCDSSWLSFASHSQESTILFSLGEGLVELTGRLGYSYAFEYENTFLIQNNVISGCCSPPDFYLYDKEDGRLKASLGRLIFYSTEKGLPFTIGLTDSNYESGAKYTGLTVYSVENNKRYFIELPRGQIEKALNKTKQNFPEYLFEEAIVDGWTVSLTYQIRRGKVKNSKSRKTIKIDLSKYGS